MTKFRTKISVLFMLILLSLSLVGTASWMIVLSKKTDIETAKEHTNPCFTASTVYNGEEQTPTLNELGIEVYGEDFISSDKCTVELLANKSKYYDGTAMSDYRAWGIAAGKHYYKITDNVTGQVICEEFEYTIERAPLTVTNIAVSGSKNAFFVGDDITLTLTVSVPGSGSKDLSVSYKFISEDYTPSSSHASVPVLSLDVEDAAEMAGIASSANIDISLPVECDLDGLAVLLPTTYVTTSVNTSPTYYGTLDDALYVTSAVNASGTTVVAMQSFIYGGETYSAATLTAANNYAHKITKNATIASNVTLVLPIDIDGTTTNRHLEKDSEGNAPEGYLPKYEPRSTNLVAFAEGDITLTLNGTLRIGGLTGAQSGTPQGITSNKYAVMEMKSGTKISVATGATIDCLGYITDPEYDVTTGVGAQISVASGATIKMPFVVHDYHGGSHTVGAYHRNDGSDDAISPFNVFDLPNVQAKIECKSGATIRGYGDLYASDVHNYTEVLIFGGAGSNSFMILENGSATFKYTPTQGADFGKNASSTNYSNSKPSYDAKTKIELNGNAKTGSLVMDVKVLVKLSDYLSGTMLNLAQTAFGGNVVTIAKTVALSDVRIPISHKFQIELNGNNDYEITSDYKFLPGSSVTVNSGAELKIGSNASAIFYSDKIYTAPALNDSTKSAASVAWLWQKDTTGIGTPRPAAAMIVNGKLDVDGRIAGVIVAGSIGAVLDLSGAKSLSISSVEGNGSYSIDVGGAFSALGGDFSKAVQGSITSVYEESSNASGIIATKNASSFSGASGNLQAKLYVSVAPSGGGYGWLDGQTSFYLNYVHVGADGQTVTNSNPTTYTPAGAAITLAVPTGSSGLKFAGWFTDSECLPENQITSLNGLTLFAANGGDATLYAKWVSSSYTLSFNTTTNSGNVNMTLLSIQVEDGAVFNPYTNKEISELVNVYRYDITYSRYFDGWYTSSSFSEATRIDENEGITVSANTTIYIKWGVKHKIVFNISTDKNITYTIPEVWLAPGDAFDIYSYDDSYKDYDYNAQFGYYFTGWCNDQARNNIIEQNIVMGESDVYVYDQWSEKISVTISNSSKISAIGATYQGRAVNNISASSTIRLIPGSSLTFTATHTESAYAIFSSTTLTSRVTVSATGYDTVTASKTDSGKGVPFKVSASVDVAWVINDNLAITVTGANK